LQQGHASAAGFQLLEQNASGIGNAYAGSAAVAENASTIFFNPAGMTQLKDREISVGVSIVRPTFKFRNQGLEHRRAQRCSGTGDDAGSWAFLPNGYLSWGAQQGSLCWCRFRRAFWAGDRIRQPLGGRRALPQVRHQDLQHQSEHRLPGESTTGCPIGGWHQLSSAWRWSTCKPGDGDLRRFWFRPSRAPWMR
jgi:hypothetical protein